MVGDCGDGLWWRKGALGLSWMVAGVVVVVMSGDASQFGLVRAGLRVGVVFF
jgi:hypothetical protein